MRILNVNQFTQNITSPKKSVTKQVPVQNPINTPNTKIFAYQDFNISFGARTPENFYEQDFNRNNMPDSMKEYLFYDYENRQHIPPQQMMAEVFKYIGAAETFEAVKEIYPDEKLFQNLHENRKNNTNNALAEIRMAKELSSTPLLKDGTDNLGMYLLRKIYLEGKTVKEINKDFYENDLNDEYKGVVTKPINTDVTSAYGIRFPKHAFWHSFIATREEYKKFFVTLPKNSVNPSAHLNGEKGVQTQTEDIETVKEVKIQPRKYKLQKFRKTQLTDDIKNSKGTTEDIEKHVRKRFGKSDPEASFLVKYLSPIMTVASNRVDMSGELKIFNEIEKSKGRQGDETFMFTRFWKNNPQLRADFAKSITDTMDMFEQIYGAGGSISINSDLEMVTPNTQNQKAIDYVSLDFIDFLDKIKNLEIERLDRYAQHDKMQIEWENHFEQMHPIVIENKQEEKVEPNKTLSMEEQEEMLRQNAKLYGAEVIELKGKEGEKILITVNIDEAFKEFLERSADIFPAAYAKLFINDMLNAGFSREFKISSIAQDYLDKIDENDSNILDNDQYSDVLFTKLTEFYNSHLDESKDADAVLADTLVSAGFKNPEVYSYSTLDYLTDVASSSSEIFKILTTSKAKMNNLYSAYKRPLNTAEKSKITLSLIDSIEKYDSENSIAHPDVKTIVLMLKDMIKASKSCRKTLKQLFQDSLDFYPYERAVINKDIPKEFKQAKFEQSVTPIILDLLETDLLVQIINRETVNKYFSKLSPYAQERFRTMVKNMNAIGHNYYNTPTSMIGAKYDKD